MTTIKIKNMVCDRCRMAVESALRTLGIAFDRVELGEASLPQPLTASQTDALRQRLSALGFELLDDRRDQTIEQIRQAVLRLVRWPASEPLPTTSNYLAAELHQDYSALSRLFSETKGITIERYLIAQRIERAKELIRYNELTLSQIAFLLHYSSTAYLSSQFKAITGMTPSQFKALKANTRLPLDAV